MPAPPPTPPKNFMEEFKEFLKKYKVMGLAVVFILDLYLGALVQALVNDIIMPFINLLLPDIPWEEIALGPNGIFLIGHFTGELVTFIVVTFVIFLLVKVSTRVGIE